MNAFETWMARTVGGLLAPGGQRGKLTILTFHNVVRRGGQVAPGDMGQDQFQQIIDVVHRLCNVLPLQDAVQALQADALPSRSAVLTFDDGYSDWVESVCPVLKAYGMPATFFLSTDHLAGRAHWHDRITDAVNAMPPLPQPLPMGYGHVVDPVDLNDREKLALRLQRSLKYLSNKDRLAVIARLEAQLRIAIAPAPLLSREAIRDMADMGFEIGAHTCTHPILTRCDTDEAWREISQCRTTLEEVIQRPVTSFAYPNGRPNLDYTAEHADMLQRAGYRCAVSTAAGVADKRSNVFQLPRFSPWPAHPARIALQLASNLRQPRALEAMPAPAADAAKKCLLIASTFPPIRGGSANVYGSLCANSPPGTLTALVAHQDFVTGDAVPAWAAHDQQQNYRVQRIPYIRPPLADAPRNRWHNLGRLLVVDLPIFLRVIGQAWTLVRRHRIRTVCIGEAVSGGWIGVALKALLRVRLVVYVHGEEITTDYTGRLGLMGRAAVLEAADQVVAVSRFARDELIARMQVPLERITVIENGIDNVRFTPGPVREDLLARHNLHGRRIVLTVGRLVRRKGVDMGLRAMQTVLAQVPDAHYLVVGDGPERDEYDALIRELGLQDHVTMVGDVPESDLVDYFRLCDLFLMPNRTLANGDTEGFGLVFREANACGKAAIGGRAGGAVEAIVEGYNGLLVDGYDAADIAQAVVQLLQDHHHRERLAANGLELARRTGVKQAAEAFNRVCLWLVAGHHGLKR